MKEKPGVMLYFDRLPYLNRMDDMQRGRLFLWIMEYAQYGVVPEIEDPMLGMAWDVVKPAIDLDTERYEAKCERNRENIQKRWNKDSNTTVSSRIPNTKPKQTQKQKQTHTQKQSQNAEEMLRLAEARLRAWQEAKNPSPPGKA